MQIAIYARVSTGRQAENELSIPDQLRQMRQWAERNGHAVVKEYIEPGASATDDKRPVFQDMISAAEQKPAPFQIIVVHSLSRFFRDMVEGALYERKLRKCGVKLVSVTQNTSDDPAGEMQRHIIMMFDEYQSKENSKHTLRAMQENARQGYFNGSKPPYGYKTIEAGQTGSRGHVKKKLAIEPIEAEIVQEIFNMYVGGIDSLRIGVKAIASRLNERNVSMRGKLWRSQMVCTIIANTAYVGWHKFNQTHGKTAAKKDESEWIKVSVPAIIDQKLYDKAAKLRTAFAPKNCVPARENSPHLLTGLLKCGHCGAGMVAMSGKYGKYRYYQCNNRRSRGIKVCPAPNIPMDRLDSLVLEAFRQKIYTPEHIREAVYALKEYAEKQDAPDKPRLKSLMTELKEVEQAYTRLLEAIEKGVIEIDDELKTRTQQHKARRDILRGEIDKFKEQHQKPFITITPQKIEAVARVLNRRLSESGAYAKAYLKATLSEIRVRDDEMRISGSNAILVDLTASNGQIDFSKRVVPSIISSWLPGTVSNRRPGD